MILFSCYEAREEATCRTDYGSEMGTKIEANHIKDEATRQVRSTS